MKEKRRLRKGVLSFSLAVIMIIGTLTSIVPGTSIKVKAETATATGVWSSGIDYSYDTATGVLTLTGNGSTTVGSSTVVINEGSGPESTINEPFSNISRIVISEGITSIGDFAFANWDYVYDFRNNLTIEIPSTVTSIGNWAFSSITNGSVSVIMNARPDNITTFYTNAFNGSRDGEFITPYASEWKESNKCSYDSTNNRITFDNTYQGIFTLSGVTYTVTYKVINGTWDGSSTADKTESVASGASPASVPAGMKADSGYTGGAWDTDPASAVITGAKTFTYTFTAIPTYEVTYKVVGGTWSDGSSTDKKETVQSGAKPVSVPAGMKASEDYTGGAWDTDPASAAITGAKTFTYSFTAKQAATVTTAPAAKKLTYNGEVQALVTAGEATGGTMQYALGTATEAAEPYTTSIPTATDAGTYYVWYKAVGSGNYKDSVPVCITVSIKKEDDSQNKGATDEKVEQHADTPETTVSGVSDELTDAVANSEEKAAVAAGSKATFTFELTNADNTVPAAEKQSLENVVRNEAPNAIVGMLLDLKAFFQVGNMPKRQLDTLNGKTVTFNFKVPEKLHAPAGIRRTFFILQNHEGKISILARTTATNIPFSAGDFSTYALAYSDENTDQEGFNTSIKIKQSEGKIKVSWDQVNGVSKVKVFATYCGKDYPSKPVKTTKGNSVTIKKLNGKKLNLKKNFKLYLVAYDKDGNKIGKTPSAHFAGKNSDKYTNPKSIKVSNKNVSVAVGANVKVKATIKLEDKKRKELPQKHAEKFRYRSTKNYIATVDKKGNIKGIAPGTCTVYVYAKNGLAKKVTVTVN